MRIILTSWVLLLTTIGWSQTTGKRYTEEEVKIEERFIEAKKYKLLGDFDISNDLFKKLLKDDPNHDVAAFELAESLNREGIYEDALHYINNAIAVDGSNKWYLLLKSDILTNQKRYAAAAEVFEQLTSQHPEDHYLLERKAYLYKQSGDLDQAISVLDVLERKTGIREKTTLIKHDLYHEMGKKNKAVEELEILADHFPDNIDYKHTLAAYLQKINKVRQAEEIYEQILVLDPQDARANVALSRHLKEEGKESSYLARLKPIMSNPEAAIDLKISELMPYVEAFQRGEETSLADLLALVEALEAAHPQDPKPFALHGDLLSLAGQHEGALEQYKRTLELDESNYLVWEQLLMTHAQLQQMEALVEAAENAMEVFPNQAMIYYLYGLGSINLQHYEDAVDGLDQALIMAGSNEDLRFNILALLGKAYHETGDYEDSDASYDKALLLKPNEPRILNDYSYHLSQRGTSLDKASEMIAKALRKVPAEPRFLATQAWVYYRQQKLDQARQTMEESIKAGGDAYGYVLEKYGDILYQSGEVDKAVKHWKLALEKGPGSRWLERKIAEEKLIEAQ